MAKNRAHRMRVWLVAVVSCGVLWGTTANGAVVRTFDAAEIAKWDYPHGLVEVGDEGVRVKPFTGPYNAMSNTDAFKSSVIGEHGLKTYRSPSNERDAALMGDQDVTTWWQPDPVDPVDKWWVEIDLGRCVAATKIRVIFPDTLDAHPFKFFSVYSSPGIALRTAPEEIRFTRIGRPVNNNKSRTVEFKLFTVDPAAATGLNLVTKDTLDFELMRFLRFEAGGVNPGAAVAEIEVETLGINLATRVTTEDRVKEGLEVWGGKTWTSNLWDCGLCARGSGAEGMIDGDLGGRYWAIETQSSTDWRTLGCWQVIDMRQTFRVNRLLWVPNILGETPYLYGFDRQRQARWQEMQFLASDGSPSDVTVADAEGPYDYKIVATVTNKTAPWRWLFDLQFPPVDARLIMWRRMNLSGSSWHRALQLFIFPALGYPKQVVVESQDLDLGGAYSVRQVLWDADVPPNTAIQVDTQTGNGYITIKRYYLANNTEVTKEKWERTKKRRRGPIKDDVIRDPSWSNWSVPQLYSGQAFQSPTPRRWVRIRARLISNDPQVMPVLHSLSFVMNSPVISRGISGRLEPRFAALDSLQDFRYTLWPNAARSGDSGFDHVVIQVPSGATDTQLLRTMVGGSVVASSGELHGDSLVVSLPGAPVRRDSVVVEFRSRVYRSPTVFDALVYNSADEENVQGVSAAEIGLDQVYVPQVEDVSSLFQNIQCDEVFTPNGDGINDAFEISFNAVNVTREPEVHVYSLSGLEEVALANAGVVVGRSRYRWDGRDADGVMVPPGIYLIRAEIKSDAGDEVLHRLVHVVY